MNKLSLQLRGFRVLLSIMVLFLLIGISTNNAWSQNFTYPQIPQLSLTGADEGYNTDWYPDGRIWLPVSQRDGAPREFLMPVFMDNKWWHYKNTNVSGFISPEPIYSFRFKILYDGIAVTPVDIVTTHPFPEDDARASNIRGDYTAPLAKDYNISWSVHNDMNYQRYFLESGSAVNIPLRVREKGRVLVISGAGTKPLPVTDTNQIDFNVLLYVKFRVNLERGSITDDERNSEYTPMYISPDTILYNDWNVRKESALFHMRITGNHENVYAFISDKYPADPRTIPTFAGLNGMNNSQISTLWNTEPILPGTIYLSLTEKLPKIWYDISRTGSQPPVWDEINNPQEAGDAMWILRDPLTVDSGQVHTPDHMFGTVKFTLRNSTSDTRLMDLWVESEAPWLTFRLESTDRSKIVQIGPTKGYVNYLDNAILGEGANKPDPMGLLTEPDAVVEMTINCDPTLITEDDGREEAGIYEGYITFRSHTADISPVRLKVTFINFRNPVEPSELNKKGIYLTLRNSRGTVGDQTMLVFGTGHRATEGVDALFGEFAHTAAQSGFGARWYHPDKKFREDNNMPFGFGDMLPNVVTPFGESRDIRDMNDTRYSHVFLCRFNADGAENYPIVLEWDITDFPDGAQLFISDTSNGELFPSVNMREATHVHDNVFSYTIHDARITSFKIEYTQPKVIDYVDADGNPIIKKGWNFLSLPVRPKNAKWDIAFPNALNTPFDFFGNGFLPQEIVRPGVGYFIKYSDKIDTKFKGVPMKRITIEGDDDGFADRVLCNEGWNTIGALSYPMNVSYVNFDERDAQSPKPNNAFVRSQGFWGYKTNVGYYESSILEPGLGYWLKIDEGKSGYLNLIHPEISRLDGDINYAKLNAMSGSTEIIVRDNGQHESSLFITDDKNVDVTSFELPPLPPYSLFDVRFYTNTKLTNDEWTVINLQGVDYPVSLTINNADANYSFIDAVTGTVLGEIKKGQSNNVEIKSTANNAIKVLKSEIETGISVSSTPNPVVSASTIKFVVPADGFITLNLFDALGNNVVLEEGYKAAGEYTVSLDASTLASGSYMCKLVAGSNSSSLKITIVK